MIKQLKTVIEKDENKKRISLEINDVQLWYIMLGLDRIQLQEVLKKGTNRLSKELQKIGKKEFDWE